MSLEALSNTDGSEASAPSTRPGDERGGWMIAGAGAAMAIGAFLPWAKVTAAFVGTISVSGMDGGDGWLFLIGGIVLGVLGWRLRFASRSLIGPSILTVILGVLAIVEVGNVSSRIDDVQDTGMASASVGFGLWLLCAAAVVSVFGILRIRSARARA